MEVASSVFRQMTSLVGKVRDFMEQHQHCFHTVQLAVAYAAPIYLAPLLMSGTKEARGAYFLLLVYACWVLNVMPAPMASSVPFVLLPLLGVMHPDKVAEYYMNEAMLFIVGVFLLALAVEGTNMYSRVALSVLGAAGAGVKAVFTGIVALSFCSTLFFKNVLSTLIVMPVVECTIVEIEHDALSTARRRRILRKASVLARLTIQPESEAQVGSTPPQGGLSSVAQLPPAFRESHSSLQVTVLQTPESGVSSVHPKGAYGQHRRSSVISVDFAEKLEQETQKYILIRRVLLLSVAYATTLGAIGSVFGNPASGILRSVLEERYAYDRFSMLPWLILCLPISVAGILACWVAVFGSFLKNFDIEQDDETRESISKILEEKKRALGTFSKLELFVLGCIIVLFVIMLLRSEFVTSFALPEEFGLVSLRDATLVFVLVLVFFITPSQPKDKLFSDYLLEWNLVRGNVPWAAFITYGGGLCVAGAVKESGLQMWLSDWLQPMRHWHPVLVQLLLMGITTVLTEVNNDTATAATLITITCDLAESSLVNPLYYAVPVTLACSTGLLLPVSSMPMALVHANLLEYSLTRVLVPVLVMKAVTLVAIFITINTTGVYYFGFNTFPQWANKTSITPSGPITNATF